MREPPRAPAGAASRAGLVLWIALAALALARAAAAFAPGMVWWGIDLGRFVPIAVGVFLLAAPLAALVPPVGRVLTPPLESAGNALARGIAGPLLACAGAALLVLSFPDRVGYVGDFLLRQGAVEQSIRPGTIFWQALPLDRLVHNSLPLALATAFQLDANAYGRILGAINAAAMMAVGVALARTLELRGAAAAAAAAVVFFGGWLGTFTGYQKAIVELAVLTGAGGVLAVRLLRTGRGVLGFGLVLALVLALHRSALALLPGAAVVLALWARDPRARGAWRRPATIVAILLPVASLALNLPSMIYTLVHLDLGRHLAPAEVRTSGGVLAGTFAGLRGLDLLNVLLLLAPLVPLAPLLAGALGRGLPRGREALALALLALPPLAAMPFIHPAQSLFRDWDVYLSTGVACTMVAAWLVAETLAADRPRAWLAGAVVLGCAGPALLWLVHHHDLDRALARMNAFVDGPPSRIESDRAEVLDAIGIREIRLGRYAAAAATFRRAAETVPSPRFFMQWAVASAELRDYPTAREAYRRVLARAPDDALSWVGYASMSMRMGELDEARRAAMELLRRQPNEPGAQRLLVVIDTLEARRARGMPLVPPRP